MTATSRSSKTLTAADYADAAKTLGVEEAAVRAVTEVESKGDGFLGGGHPVILFERHIMYRQVRDKFGPRDADTMALKHPDIVNPKPGGYGTTDSQPERMERAATLDRDCALQSASWGLFQIMGFHWRALGYASLQAFINAMYKSEAEHLFAFTRFIKINPHLHKALKDLSWKAFARGYNGVNYAINQYDAKLEAAYRKHSAKEAA